MPKAIEWIRQLPTAGNPPQADSHLLETSISATARDHIQCRRRRMDVDGGWFQAGDRHVVARGAPLLTMTGKLAGASSVKNGRLPTAQNPPPADSRPFEASIYNRCRWEAVSCWGSSRRPPTSCFGLLTMTGKLAGASSVKNGRLPTAQNPPWADSRLFEASISAHASDHIQSRGRTIDADGRRFHVGDRHVVRPLSRTDSSR
jgi:hypothetical protein